MRSGLALALFLVLPLAACHGGAAKTEAGAHDLRVDNAWIRLAAAPSGPSAAYFTIQGGKADERLTGVTSPQAARAEMHQTMTGDHNMTMMAPLKEVLVPAGGTVTFAPGGRHVMLFGLDPAAAPGSEVRLDLVFAGGRKLSTEARVRAMGDAGP